MTSLLKINSKKCHINSSRSNNSMNFSLDSHLGNVLRFFEINYFQYMANGLSSFAFITPTNTVTKSIFNLIGMAKLLGLYDLFLKIRKFILYDNRNSIVEDLISR